ncbi:unnamed protein product [Rotaria sordida]|uniref:Uncharacterized protein n=1 Tax=Rotaria sordida TaxID=392033 RepID=A0A814KR79_9BILA|nr:unnamed protein product [Rotaria sordida]CAF3895144.1 unnamed protein product [Rotaria sordida]
MQFVILLIISGFVKCSTIVHTRDIGDNFPSWNNILDQNHNEFWQLISDLHQNHSKFWEVINDLKQKLSYQEQELHDLKKSMSDQQQKIDVQQKTIEKLPTFCQGKTSFDQWKPYTIHQHGIVVYVNTTSCQFKQSPTYFTSLSGHEQHWQVTGTTSIYDETPTGFAVFLSPMLGAETIENTMAMLPVRKWELNWIGVTQGK